MRKLLFILQLLFSTCAVHAGERIALWHDKGLGCFPGDSIHAKVNLQSVDGSEASGVAYVDLLTPTGYDYNLQGWLTHSLAENMKKSNATLFEENLYYTEDNGYYNGNIRKLIYKSADAPSAEKGFSYVYDNMDRMRSAVYTIGYTPPYHFFHVLLPLALHWRSYCRRKEAKSLSC